MFAKLPQKLPFNLLGDEAKLAFRSQQGGIARLAATRVSVYALRAPEAAELATRIFPRPSRIGIK